MANYTVNTRKNGKHTVSYECGHCQAALESPLQEAGQTFACPTCGRQIETPGIEERKRQQQAERQRQREAEQLDAVRTAEAHAEAVAQSQPAAQANLQLSRGMNGIHYRNCRVTVDDQTLRSDDLTIPLRAITALRGCTVKPDLSPFWFAVLFVLVGLVFSVAGFSNGFVLSNVGLGVIAGVGFIVLGIVVALNGNYRNTFQILIAVPGTDGYAAVFTDRRAAQFFHHLLAEVIAGHAPKVPYAMRPHDVWIVAQTRRQESWFIIWW